MGSVGVWYLNFGRIGVLIGGILTGLVLSSATKAMSSTRTNPYAFVMAFSAGLYVIIEGVDGEFVVKWAQWVLPMFFVLRYVRRATPASNLVPVEA